MKKIKALSLLATLVTLTVISIHLYGEFVKAPKVSEKRLSDPVPLSQTLGDTLSTVGGEKANDRTVDLQVLTSLLYADTLRTESNPSILLLAEKNDLAMTLIQKLNEENKKLKEELTLLKNPEDKEVLKGSVDLSKSGTQMFLAKALFSFLFCISALYVVLSNKYNEDTTKWAFSVLSLIAGVWIGTLG